MRHFLAVAIILALCSPPVMAQTLQASPPPANGHDSCHAKIHDQCPDAHGYDQVQACLKQKGTTFEQLCPEAAAKHAAEKVYYDECHQTVAALCPDARGAEQEGECIARAGKTFADLCPQVAAERAKHPAGPPHDPPQPGAGNDQTQPPPEQEQ